MHPDQMPIQPDHDHIPLSWAAVLPALIILLENGTFDGKSFARQELRRLAEIADGRQS